MPEEVLWERWDGPVEYSQAVEIMQSYAARVKNGSAQQRVMLLQHPAVYTSPNALEASTIKGIKLKQTNRGGGITYHGPGQRLIYPILDLKRYKRDLYWYVSTLESWVVETLRHLKVPAFTKKLSRGIWLEHDSHIAKIGFVGIRVEGWITLHGCAINVLNSTEHFLHINPCGIEGCRVTSCQAAGYEITMEALDLSLMRSFNSFFRLGCK